MNVKRYFAQTAREALRQLKEELGADAIVLSNRSVDGGVEIVALPADAVEVLHQSTRSAPVAAKPAPAKAPVPVHEDDEGDYRVQLSSARRPVTPAAQPARAPAPAPTQQIRPFQPPRVDRPVMHHEVFPRHDDMRPAEPQRAEPLSHQRAPAARPVPAEPRREEESARIRALQETNTRLMEEMGGIRAMLERQLAGFAWGEAGRQAPARTRMTGELLEAGFSAQLARTLCDAVDPNAELSAARNAVKTALNRGLRALSNDADVIDRGGVYALVGPTGVGKTTTAAKLAARCVVRHGADKLALITTDGYRIGAHEQLRIYGRILGVPVHVVRDAGDLRQTLAELRDKHMVLIDTVGMSQRDRMVGEQAAMLTGAGNVNRLLLLNATCRGDTLDDVVRAYDGPELAGCILTKVDEAASLAPALDVAVRHEMSVYYVANGQRVPEDLHLPNRAYLLHRAMKAVDDNSPYHLKGEEAGLLMASAGA
ncbi:MAG: flagellar biosynthesis protein FlhF [Denitromonas halophila]|nr:MAG: flagellar biosynthesis protein FlhF [Denitromonas halophila]TVT71887.1 MAG: flagellar biosynthesis protein FlhF [Denitromonas halophila]